MFATVSIEAPFDDGDVSSVDSNCQDDNNMILGNFVSDKMKRKYMSSEWNDYIFRIGQFFTGGAVEFRDKLCKYAVENGFQFRYMKNDKSRITVVCAKKKKESCQWYVHASLRQSNNFFYITKLNNEHTCVCVIRHQRHKRLGSDIVSTIISDKVRANPLVKTRDIMDYLKQDYGFEVAYHTAYRGKDAANRSLHGDEGIGYGYLPWYLEAVKRTNPGSRCVLDTQDGRFCRLFIAYGASLHGFQYCPPILFVDGTFIKNKYKGMLLGACAKTGNKGMINFGYLFCVVAAILVTVAVLKLSTSFLFLY